MVLPVLFGYMFLQNRTLLQKTITIFFICFFVLALVLSYTRAAWVSILGGVLVYLAIVLKPNKYIIFTGVMLLIAIAVSLQDKFLLNLETNRQDSSTNISDHVKSISNISSDASNLERLNRWASAIRMFKEKPILGFGPGTYSFKYAPYQFSYEKTIISTNSGDKGNAHSEYIGPLCESGILGLLTFLAIVVAVCYTSINRFYNIQNKNEKVLLISSFIGLVTYFIHGFLNNFLDSDKAAVIFWGYIAFILSLDLKYLKEEKKLQP
jgi:putative inorganic carbon (hco3(-)) transporter